MVSASNFVAFVLSFFNSLFEFLFVNSVIIGNICIGHFLVVFLILALLIGFFVRGS